MGVATLRETLIRQLDLVVSVGSQIGIVNDQYQALVRGGVVIFTGEQLASFGFTHPDLPGDLTSSTHWALQGESTMTAVG